MNLYKKPMHERLEEMEQKVLEIDRKLRKLDQFQDELDILTTAFQEYKRSVNDCR